jgi:hypothetical protein
MLTSKARIHFRYIENLPSIAAQDVAKYKVLEDHHCVSTATSFFLADKTGLCTSNVIKHIIEQWDEALYARRTYKMCS